MRTFGIPFPLLDKADGGSGGGGGDGGGKQEPAGLSEDLKKEVGGMIAAALKGEGKRMVAASVKEALAELKLGETIAAEVAKLKPAEPDDKDKKPDGKPDPKVAALEAKLQEVTGKLEAEAKARELAQNQARDEKAFASLKTALGPHVRPEALEIAARDLFTGQKRVTVDEQGNVLLKVRRAPYAGAAEEDTDMPLADGVQHWIKSSEGKFFAPVPGAGGADPKGGAGPRRSVQLGGDGLPKYDQPATTDAEKIRRATEREQAYREKFPHLP